MAQSVRALPSHGRGHRFESCYAHRENAYSTGNLDTDDRLRATERATTGSTGRRKLLPRPAPSADRGLRASRRQRRCRYLTSERSSRTLSVTAQLCPQVYAT